MNIDISSAEILRRLDEIAKADFISDKGKAALKAAMEAVADQALPIFKHLRSGNGYQLLSDQVEACSNTPIPPGARVCVYRRIEDGALCVRDAAEFEDRFIQVQAA